MIWEALLGDASQALILSIQSVWKHFCDL